MATPLQRSRLGRGLASLIGEPSNAMPRLPPEGAQKVAAGAFAKGIDYKKAYSLEFVNKGVGA